jgi:cytochrome c-type biogenesis protein CcmH/NrfG
LVLCAGWALLAVVSPTSADDADDQADLERVIERATAEIRLDPQALEPYLTRALAFVKTRAFDNAIADYNEAIRIKPDRSQTYADRGSLLRVKG